MDSGIGPDTLKILSNVETKLDITNALSNLMKKQDIDKISVSAICNEVGISRATFYRYFKDKFAIVEWYLRYLNHNGVDRIGRNLSWYEGYFISTGIIADHLDFFANAARSDDRNSLDRIAPRQRRDTIIKTITDYHHTELTDHLRFQVNSVVLTETHLFPSWNYGKYDCTLEEICTWMVECIPQQLFELLNTPVNPSHIAAEDSSAARLHKKL
jgi:AcrR family transcriptional regulator